MSGASGMGSSRSLSRRIDALEQRIMLRRRLVQSLVTGIKQEFGARMASPTVLLTAAGIGAAMEQTSRHRGWSLAAAFDAAHAGIRLLLSVLYPAGAVRTRTAQSRDREFNQR